MESNKACVICDCPSEGLRPAFVSLIPIVPLPSVAVKDVFNIFTGILTSFKDESFNQICNNCCDEIQRIYFFIEKCERSKAKMIPDGSKIEDTPHIKQIIENITEKSDNYINMTSDAQNIEPAFEQDINAEPEVKIEMEENDFTGFHDAGMWWPLKVQAETNESNEKRENTENPMYSQHFQCSICSKKFKSKDHLARHINTCQFACKKCSKKFKFRFGKNAFQCDRCFKKFKSKLILRRHVKRAHETYGYTCKICLNVFENARIFQNHIKHPAKCEPKKNTGFNCWLCSSSFDNKSNLSHHMLLTHVDELPLTCEICSTKFKTKYNLKTHLQRHANEKTYECSLCSKALKDASSLKRHMRLKHFQTNTLNDSELNLSDSSLLVPIDAPQQLICEICSTKFKNKYNLKMHLQRHSNDSIVECHSCSKSFKDPSSLTRHIKLKHPDLLRSHKNRCNICLKYFESAMDLDQHIESSHTCQFCSKRFCSLANFEYHMEEGLCIPSEKRRLLCTKCWKLFGAKKDLKRHDNLIHNDGKPFQCEQCSQLFTERDHLYEHERSVHNMNTPVS